VGSAEWRSRLASLSKKHPELFTSEISKAQLIDWHMRQQAECERDNNPYGREWHLRRLIEVVEPDEAAAAEALEKADAMLEEADRVHRMFLAMARLQPKESNKARELHAQRAAWIASFAQVRIDVANYPHLLMGAYDKAIRYYGQAIKLRPDNDLTYVYRSAAHREKGDYAKAIEDCTAALRINPKLVTAFYNRAIAYRLSRRYSEAMEDVNTGLEIAPDNGALLHERALNYGYLGAHDKAIADFSKAIKLGKRGCRAWYEAVLSHLAAGNVACYQEACRSMVQQFRETDDPPTAEVVAWSCALAPDALSRYDDVVLLAKRAVAESQQNPRAHTYLGAVLYRAGQVEEGAGHLAEANRFMGESPGNVRSSPAFTWYFLAMAHHAQGNAEEASRWLARATAWTEEVLAKHESGTAKLSWNRRVALQILRKETEALIGEASEGKNVPTDAE
jgi:tetratricopeptide (TPR) repeat protein